jgi:hypothetical protein
MNKRDLQRADISVSKEVHKLVAASRKAEFPRNVKRCQRNGNERPLTAFMAGAREGEPSKITAVLDGRARYPYSTHSAAVYVLARRIVGKKKITSAQYLLLLEYLSHRYRGRIDSEKECRNPDLVIDADVPDDLFWESRHLLEQAAGRSEMPLRAILSQRLTDLILLHQLFQATQKANQTWKRPN